MIDKRKAVILDLDNTLYSWMDAYTSGIARQIKYLAKVIAVDENRITADFKRVYKKYGSVEIPSAVFELHIWDERNSVGKLKKIQNDSNQYFFKAFDENLRLFPEVVKTLKWLKKNNILVFGFSDAYAFWVDYRLRKLKILRFFCKIYAKNNDEITHSKLVRKSRVNRKIQIVKDSELKPNIEVIEKIIYENELEKENVFMIGDSLENDVFTAKKAQIVDVWAKYGKKYSHEKLRIIRQVTPWAKDKGFKKEDIHPTYTINKFSEIISLLK